MIFTDTSTLVAWLDQAHEHHGLAMEAMTQALTEDEVAVSVFVLGELAAGRHSAGLSDAASIGRTGDPGISDKRMMAVESEPASAFIAAGREKSTLSPVNWNALLASSI